MLFYELYTDQDALTAHGTSDGFKAIGASAARPRRRSPRADDPDPGHRQGTLTDHVPRLHRRPPPRGGGGGHPAARRPPGGGRADVAAPRLHRRAARAPGISVIAEIKRRSPSKGDLAVDLDARAVAQAYEAGGATCLSVLTDAEFFGGSIDDLNVARAETSLPVLRKDFTVSANDVADARLMAADAVLLIAAALGRDELIELHAMATGLGLDVLVEIHDEAELDVAVAAGATLVGVNQRDLTTFEVDPERAARHGRRDPRRRRHRGRVGGPHPPRRRAPGRGRLRRRPRRRDARDERRSGCGRARPPGRSDGAQRVPAAAVRREHVGLQRPPGAVRQHAP